MQVAITTNTTTGLTVLTQSLVIFSTGGLIVFLSSEGIVRAQLVEVGEATTQTPNP